MMGAWLLPMGLAVALAGDPIQASGTYEVASVREGSSPEEIFSDKMRRRALALGLDCYVTRRTYRFRGRAGGGAPQRVEVTDAFHCEKGGLGAYTAYAALEVDVVWTEGDPALMKVFGGTAWTTATRLEQPEGMRVVAQWAAPDVRWVLEPAMYEIRSERPRGGKRAALRLKDGDTEFRLLPVAPEDGARPPSTQ